MKRSFLPRPIHNFLRKIIYNTWTERAFYPRGYPANINGEKIRLPFRFSKFYPDVYEVEKTEFIKQHCKPGTTTIDIGAHIGVFSYFLAKQVGTSGKVLSFEPTPFTFGILQQTIRFNGLENIIEPRRQAVSNSHDDVTFYVSGTSDISNANSIREQNTSNEHAKAIRVSAVSLDDFLNDKDFKDLSFIKIDAEGAELEILKGGLKLIGKYRPHMTLEVHPKSFADPRNTQKEIFDLLVGQNYKIFKDHNAVSREEFCSFTECFEVFLLSS